MKGKICQNKTIGEKALKMLDDLTIKYKETCRMPCNYVTVDHVKLKEYDSGRYGNCQLILSFYTNIKKTKEFYLYTPLSLVAEVGGYIGLFLGVSIYQLTDLFNYLFSKCN